MFIEKLTNLNNVISILILSQHADRPHNFVHHYLLSFWVTAMLQNPLSHENKHIHSQIHLYTYLHVSSISKLMKKVAMISFA